MQERREHGLQMLGDSEAQKLFMRLELIFHDTMTLEFDELII